MQSQKNGFMMKNSKNGSVDGFDQYNEKAASQRNDGINQGLENKDELRDFDFIPKDAHSFVRVIDK